jgi:hypothetical protein
MGWNVCLVPIADISPQSNAKRPASTEEIETKIAEWPSIEMSDIGTKADIQEHTDNVLDRMP